ncbi:MAG: glycogen-binding domain-containing protein, partial [Deltaproteobacteria bacterium]|nr:glycogen-binding domain-containing protein [Deltaproteobacteria bacterium]
IGGGYRFYRFSFFSEDRFHEPHAWFELALTHGEHRLSAMYSYAYRRMPAERDPPDLHDRSESEHAARLLWEILFAGIVTLGIGLEYDHIRGTDGWMQEDALKAVLGLEVEWRMIDAGVAYVPGLMWLENEGMGMLNRVSVWAGGRYPEWIRYGLEYRYDDLMEIDGLQAEVPYDRHLALFTVTLRWGISTPGSGVHPAVEAGAATTETIVVSAGHATFRAEAPEASSVSLAGSFNGWQTPGPVFEGPDEDGMWILELDLPAGRHELVYVIDGETVTPRNAPAYASDGFGGKNAAILVP